MRSFFLLIFASSTASAQIEFQTRRLDFGTIWRGNQIERTIQFVNRGPTHVKIEGIDAGCGCIAVERELNKTYAPGEAGSLLVRFDSSNYQGQIRRQIGIWDGTGKIQALYINTNIKESFQVLPPLVDFGQGDWALHAKKLVILKSNGGSKVKILSVVNPLSFIHTEVMKDEGSLAVSFISDAPKGRNLGMILVRTNDPHLAEVKIPIIFSQNEDSLLGKRYLEFGSIEPGKTVLRRLNLSREGLENKTLKPTRLQLNGKDLPLDSVLVVPEADGFSISISHRAPQSGAFSGALNLVSDEGVETNVDYFGFFL